MRLASMALSAGQQHMRSGVSVIWRERMTSAITSRYLANNNFYAMKHCDRRITDAETRITQLEENLEGELATRSVTFREEAD